MAPYSPVHPRFTFPLLACLLVAALLLVPGCKDPTVDVLRPSDQFQVSLFGALDVAADTQFIRVEPLGDSTQIGAPRDLNATVFLENLDSGEQIPLQDSLTNLGVFVHNVWTTHPIQPSTSYRIVVQSQGETVTTATTTTPSRTPDLSHTIRPDTALRLPCVFPVNPNNQRKAANTFTVTAKNVERIAAVRVRYPIPSVPPQTPRFFNHSGSVEIGEEGDFIISVFYRRNLVRSNPDIPSPGDPMDDEECVDIEDFARPYAFVVVSAGGPDWPDWRGLPLNEIARPDSFSNVQGGHGFVGAIYSDTIKVPVTGRP